MPTARPFLTADWRYLLMLNYEIDPRVLQPLVPAGVELDTWQGKTLVSMVGFLFLKTRVLGLPVPGHRNFEEVNLRFYVRRKVGEEWRRGVVFVKEIVPKPWIARLARLLYRENYVALPMRHTIESRTIDRSHYPLNSWLVEFSWRFCRKFGISPNRPGLHRLGGLAHGSPAVITEGSEEAFITEHYWGYTRLNKKSTAEYRVEHPRWQVWPVVQPYLLCDVNALYGAGFADALNQRPCSAFLAEGSPVKVYWGSPIK